MAVTPAHVQEAAELAVSEAAAAVVYARQVFATTVRNGMSVDTDELRAICARAGLDDFDVRVLLEVTG